MTASMEPLTAAAFAEAGQAVFEVETPGVAGETGGFFEGLQVDLAVGDGVDEVEGAEVEEVAGGDAEFFAKLVEDFFDIGVFGVE
jgi:hypothetical protein